MRKKQHKPAWYRLAKYWTPLLILMGVICVLSSQSHDQQNLQPWLGSQPVVEKVVKEHLSDVRLHYSGSEVSVSKLGVPAFVEFFIRKAAHFTEYFLLGLLSYRLIRSWRTWSVPVSMGVALLFSGAFASLDEFHQSFTPNRTPMVTDVMLDTGSALVGIVIYAISSLLDRYWKRKSSNGSDAA